MAQRRPERVAIFVILSDDTAVDDKCMPVFEIEAQVEGRTRTIHRHDALATNGLTANDHRTIVRIRHMASSNDLRVGIDSPWAPDQHRIGTAILPDKFIQMAITQRLASGCSSADMQPENGPGTFAANRAPTRFADERRKIT
jgi:hypothetical protein